MKVLSKQKNCFTWPSKEDSFTYLENEILCKFEPDTKLKLQREISTFRRKLQEIM